MSKMGQRRARTSNVSSFESYLHRDFVASIGFAGTQAMRAFFINADLDISRRAETLAMCEQLQLQCARIVPPALDSPDVLACVSETASHPEPDRRLRPWECSLSHTHKMMLSIISTSFSRAAVFEDDARLNAGFEAGAARKLLDAVVDDFVMGGWCKRISRHLEDLVMVPHPRKVPVP